MGGMAAVTDVMGVSFQIVRAGKNLATSRFRVYSGEVDAGVRENMQSLQEQLIDDKKLCVEVLICWISTLTREHLFDGWIVLSSHQCALFQGLQTLIILR